MGVTEIASAMRMNKTTVHRLLNAMAKFDFVEQNAETDRYRLGLRLYELGGRALQSRSLQQEAHRYLLEMSRRSRETVSLAVHTAGAVICLDRVQSPYTMISLGTAIGGRFPAHCTAVGKAVLAYLARDQVDAILRNNGMPRYTPSTLTLRADLESHLRQIRRRGYAVDQQELERGLNGVAAPVRTTENRAIAAVGMAGPTLRFRGSELREKIALVRETAEKLSRSLGYSRSNAGASERLTPARSRKERAASSV